ncbi:diguanylate cyclase (GGDEF) domain-containing protein [Pollutimonas bauzanensis]|uniref:diguanylate cyclase n=2 Tax=Pollutimonas bauzanensis TaxID=658167 RepID=A0A1M5Y8L1_9BURK|nr:diguanylate cyclase (GGDEF) domain-containing protein [Pollutimonas bauzanensis]
MMLANGGVFGLMHRDLPVVLRPAAVSWQVGTLLVAAGCLIFVLQRYLPLALMVTLANGLVMLGLTAYWHSLRQFYGYPSSVLLLLPMFAGTLGVFWFAAFQPDTGVRIMIASAVWLSLMWGSATVLKAQAHRDSALSRRVLLAIFAGVMLFTAIRAGYYLLLGVTPDFSVLDYSSWMNLATPVVGAVLPVVGTTAFVLMCSERIRRQWERAAGTDYLTGLANRRTLTEIGALRFATARGRDGGLVLALIDIDHFKGINDKHGHAVGDIALRHVAARIESSARGGEMPARLGGEEFVVLLDHVDHGQARAAGERLRLAVQNHPFTAGELQLPITVSIGMAICRADDDNFDCLMQRADQALYMAKAAGRNRVELVF